MLSYAFQILKEQGYKNIETENFDNTAELFAAILIKGVSLQVKRGLNQEYIAKTEPLSTIRGKVDITESIKGQTLLKKQLVCSYDEFSVNSYFNRIVKSTMELLLRADISKARKKELRKLLVYFSEVETLDIYHQEFLFPYKYFTFPLVDGVCYDACCFFCRHAARLTRVHHSVWYSSLVQGISGYVCIYTSRAYYRHFYSGTMVFRLKGFKETI